MKRIIEISNAGYSLHFSKQQLVLKNKDKVTTTIPIEDMAALVIDHPQTIITQTCLSSLLNANVMVITSDHTHQPNGMWLPLHTHTLQTERFSTQLHASNSVKKSLWKQLIKTKVMLQSAVLISITQNDRGLTTLAKKVRSGDPDNIEAQAARRYWSSLFSENKFKRDRFAEDQNRYLNYTYAIVRGLVSRSLCAAGLHPSIGIHHHNRYNAYCLADDIMEPYRPFADLHVWECTQTYGHDRELDKTLRKDLLNIITHKIKINNELLTLQGAIQKTAQSLAKVFQGTEKQLILPNI